jgi:hypothetical protein
MPGEALREPARELCGREGALGMAQERVDGKHAELPAVACFGWRILVDRAFGRDEADGADQQGRRRRVLLGEGRVVVDDNSVAFGGDHDVAGMKIAVSQRPIGMMVQEV